MFARLCIHVFAPTHPKRSTFTQVKTGYFGQKTAKFTGVHIQSYTLHAKPGFESWFQKVTVWYKETVSSACTLKVSTSLYLLSTGVASRFSECQLMCNVFALWWGLFWFTACCGCEGVSQRLALFRVLCRNTFWTEDAFWILLGASDGRKLFSSIEMRQAMVHIILPPTGNHRFWFPTEGKRKLSC